MGPLATLAAFQRGAKIDLCVVTLGDRSWVREYIEKPTYHYTVSTGIYVFEPAVLGMVTSQGRMDMPELIQRLLAVGHRVAAYPFRGIWLDIGRPDDYEQAMAEFELHHDEFLPTE